MVQELSNIADIYDADGDLNNGVQLEHLNADTSLFDDLKGDIVTAVIDGVGSIPGLDTLTGSIPLGQDLDPNTADVTESINSIVEKHVSEGMQEFLDQTPGDAGNKTIDEIFKDTIEETTAELETYNSDIFSGT